MKHPKTTLSGILLVVSSLALIIAHVFDGTISVADLQNLITAVGGMGLIGAADSTSTPGA